MRKIKQNSHLDLMKINHSLSILNFIFNVFFKYYKSKEMMFKQCRRVQFILGLRQSLEIILLTIKMKKNKRNGQQKDRKKIL